jgi:hypothetical protein
MQNECGCAKNMGVLSSKDQAWFVAYYAEGTGPVTGYLEVDEWLDTSDWLDAYVWLEFQGIGGEHMTATLQTAVALSFDDAEWVDVTDADSILSAPHVVLQAPSTLAQPVMGVTRIKLTVATGESIRGKIRGRVVLKQAG